MDEIKKELKEMKDMLRAVINGQSKLRETMMAEDKKTRDMLMVEIKKNQEGIAKNGKRIDMLGEQLNELDDDAPTGEEFRKLEKRVTKVERKLASA